MSCGEDGKRVIRMNWDNFCKSQRWDEFPELSNDPPFTNDMSFWYMGKHYILAGIREGVGIFTYDNYKEVLYDHNFLSLLTKPFIKGKSFKDIINEMEFDI